MKNDRNVTVPYAGPRPFVSRHTRKLVSDAIEALCAGNLPTFVETAKQLHVANDSRGDVVAGIAEWFDADDRIARSIAAGVFLMNKAKGSPETSQMRRAEAILVDALRSDDAILLMVTCGVLTHCHLPKSLASLILPLTEHVNEFVRVTSAASLVSTEHRDARLLAVLTRALSHDDKTLSSIACSAMLRLGIQQGATRTAFEQILRSLHSASQYQVWLQLRTSEIRNTALFELAMDSVRDEKLHSSIRGAAAAALSTVSDDDDAVARCLVSAVKDVRCPWQLLSGAIDALGQIGRLPVLRNRLGQFLTARDEQTRFTAAYGFYKLGPDAALAADLLLSRLSEDESLRVRQMSGHALAAIASNDVIQALVDRLPTLAGADSEVTLGTLRYTGRPAAAALGRLFRKTTDPQLAGRIAGVFAAWGEDAQPALADIGHVLDHTLDPDLAYICVGAIIGLGEHSVPGLPHLINWLTEYDPAQNVAARWALVGLFLQRSDAIPLIQSAMSRIDGTPRDRLKHVLEQLRPGNDPRLGYLERAGNEAVLADFAAVALLLADGSVSYRILADRLNDNGTAVQDVSSGRARTWSEQRVRRLAIKMGEIAGTEVVTKSVDGRTSLTDIGRRVANDVLAYLRWIESRRSPTF